MCRKVVEASLDKQFRGIVQYTWVSYDDAANYFLDATRSTWPRASSTPTCPSGPRNATTT